MFGMGHSCVKNPVRWQKELIYRGLLSITPCHTALSYPRLVKNTRVTKHSPGYCQTKHIYRNSLHACCTGMQLVVSGLQRAPGCYSSSIFTISSLNVYPAIKLYSQDKNKLVLTHANDGLWRGVEA